VAQLLPGAGLNPASERLHRRTEFDNRVADPAGVGSGSIGGNMLSITHLATILTEGRRQKRGLAGGSSMAAPLEDPQLADARGLAPTDYVREHARILPLRSETVNCKGDSSWMNAPLSSS
jgi:hypothetical protein